LGKVERDRNVVYLSEKKAVEAGGGVEDDG
jgi:hypothetical protein